MIETIAKYRRDRSLNVVADFDRTAFDPRHDFHRIGGGSMGGKARGLAFMRMLLAKRPVTDGLDATVTVPAAVVLATDVFDRFLDDNDLRKFAIHTDDDAEIERRFLKARFPSDIYDDLAALMPRMDYPLAVRSSSLLEDSQHQPFAGIYETFMLANREAKPERRLERLIQAIVRVYASTFSHRAKDYIAATPYRLEEEKMAVIVQRIVGTPHGSRFYPSFAGVARSHNFYPTPPLVSSDGIAAVALGLVAAWSRTGCACGSAAPSAARPGRDDQGHAGERPARVLALDLESDDTAMRETRYDLEVAEADGTLAPLASTYSHDNAAIYDGMSRPGMRLVSFAPILKQDTFPLAQLLDRLLEIGRWAWARRSRSSSRSTSSAASSRSCSSGRSRCRTRRSSSRSRASRPSCCSVAARTCSATAGSTTSTTSSSSTVPGSIAGRAGSWPQRSRTSTPSCAASPTS